MLRYVMPCIALVAVAPPTPAADTPPDLPPTDEVEAGLFRAISAFHVLGREPQARLWMEEQVRRRRHRPLGHDPQAGPQ
ncbi:MAG: hypothetical protein PVH68_19795, partial [Armatimonadota bacterium]